MIPVICDWAMPLTTEKLTAPVHIRPYVSYEFDASIPHLEHGSFSKIARIQCLESRLKMWKNKCKKNVLFFHPTGNDAREQVRDLNVSWTFPICKNPTFFSLLPNGILPFLSSFWVTNIHPLMTCNVPSMTLDLELTTSNVFWSQ